jgi:HAD superfamily hydrolase (TIGR01549 family)
VKKKIKLVLLDLDGVLVDTKSNMNLSWNKVKKDFKLTASFKNYFKYVGMPFENILKKLSIKKNINEIYKTYKVESFNHFNKIKLYPGVKKTIPVLKKKNIKLGIVTSKDKKRTEKLLKKFKLNIKLIISPSKGLKGKPHPDQILKAIKMSAEKSSATVYVGDMFVDYKAAKSSGVSYIHAKYGYGKNNDLYVNSIKKFNDLLKFL